jgi:hypothetical protein
MLIQKSSHDVGDVVTFKLTNGDEIVAKIVEITGEAWKIERPCTVVPSQKGIMLVASLFTAEPDFRAELKMSHVLLHSATAQQVRDHYIEQTTGIKPVSASSLITGI